MRRKNGKAAALALFTLIIASAAVFARAVWEYGDAPWRNLALAAAGLAALIYIILESLNFARCLRAGMKTPGANKAGAASALSLVSEDGTAVKSWDLRGRIGLVVGRGAEADVDLSDSEYFSLISEEHAVLNYAAGDWHIADAGSRNGTALSRGASGRKLLLAPGEPVPIRPGDTVYIAEETILAVR